MFIVVVWEVLGYIEADLGERVVLWVVMGREGVRHSWGVEG